MSASEAVLAFLQGAIGGLPTAEPDFDAARALMREHRTLRADSVALWPAATRSGLGELLKHLLIVMEFDRVTGGTGHPDPRLAEGTSASRLGAPLLAYILQRADDLESLYRRHSPSPE
jgi:hypothetical protein